MALKVEIIGTHIIKPSSPTPHHLKHFKLSLLDQLSAPIYTHRILFYQVGITDRLQRSLLLKTSLSEVLTRFYPFAGKINGDVSIDCNDDGIPYLEADIGCSLSEILKEPDPNVMNQFLPTNMQSKESHSVIPLIVQTSFFECGGMVIGFCASHKIFDAVTLSTFIHCWANTALGKNKEAVDVSELFTISSLFPAADSSDSRLEVRNMEIATRITRRFVFNASSLAALKVKAMNEGACKPTRVQAVTALIWKCAMNASSASTPKKRSSILLQAVNMRRRLDPPLPETTIGNFSWLFCAKKNYESKIDLGGVVDEIRKGWVEFCDTHMKEVKGSEEGCSAITNYFKECGNKGIGSDETQAYWFTSWCGLRTYDADFGWGKPTWISLPKLPVENYMVLMDTQEGEGIEAWISLSEQHMVVFEHDQDWLAFASPNPSVT